MKTYFASLLILALTITSCQKETTPAVIAAAQVKTYQIEMVVYAMSSDVTIKYTQPDGEKLPIVTVTSKRKVNRFEFEAKSKMNLTIEAFNTNPAKDEIIIELFVDGKFTKSTSVNAIGAIAQLSYSLN